MVAVSERLTRLRQLRPTREASIVVAFSALNVVGGLVGNRVLTQVVAPKLLGEFYLLLNLAQWLIVPTMGANIYLMRHWPIALTHRQAGRFTRAIGKGFVVQAIVAALGVLVIRYFDLGISSISGELALWLASLALVVQQAFDPVQNMARRRITAGILAFFVQPFRPFALAAGLLLLAAPTGIGLLGVQAFYSGVVALLTFGCLLWLIAPGRSHADLPAPPDPELAFSGFKSHFVPYFFGAALTQGCFSAERWGLARLADPGSTALFVQAVGLSMAVAGSSVSFVNTYYYPIIFRSAEGQMPLRAAAKPIRRYFYWVTTILVLAVLGVWVLAPTVTPILFGMRFHAVVDLLPWAMLGSALFILGETVGVLAFTARETVVSNFARWAVQVGYIAALVLVRPSGNAALMYCKIYVCKNLMHVIMMGAVGLWLLARERLVPPLPPSDVEGRS
jgi:O-antigen/teichoic acid export membrane protein